MSSPTDTRDPLDRSQIDFLLSLDDGEGNALAEIVSEYLAVSEEARTELHRQLREGDWNALERTAHTLKGASANVGATGLAEVCARLEAGARAAEHNAAADLLDQFDRELTSSPGCPRDRRPEGLRCRSSSPTTIRPAVSCCGRS